MRKIILLIAAAFLISGCASLDPSGKSVLQGGRSFTAPIQNPVGRQQLAAIESAYGVALVVAVNYRRLGLCPRGQTESVTNVCARRGVVLALQDADRKVRPARTAARNFVRDNPTISGASALDAFRAAVTDFQNVAANNGVR